MRCIRCGKYLKTFKERNYHRNNECPIIHGYLTVGVNGLK